MIERWSRDQVLALAPDAPSQKAAQGVAAAGKWSLRGTTDDVLFGECRGSGSKPYLACVDLTEPAYRCSCPSRKFPCKHALGLLLLWSADGVPVKDAAPQWVTEWLDGRAERAARSAAKIEAARAKTADSGDQPQEAPATGEGPPAVGASRSAGEGRSVGGEGRSAGAEGRSAGGQGRSAGGEGQSAGGQVRSAGSEGRSAGGEGRSAGGESVRHARVAAGLGELERWLADQIRQGLATSADHDWDGLAKRLIDAQAPGIAGLVSRLAHVRREDNWPGRLLEEYALINLLAVAYRRRAGLPASLCQTVHIRTGFPVTREEVLAGPAVRDHWDVLGRRDDEQDRLTARRVWLRGRTTGRAALVLSFAPPGHPLDASLVTGTTIDADLTFYPGAAPLRALVATRHPAPAAPPDAHPAPAPGAAVPPDARPVLAPSAAVPPDAHLVPAPDAAAPPDSHAAPARSAPAPSDALHSAPVLAVPPGMAPGQALDEVARALGEDPWTESWPLVLAGVVPGRATVGGLPLHPKARDPWRLIAVSGGHPVTVAVEWTPQGLRPLTTWDDEGTAVIL